MLEARSGLTPARRIRHVSFAAIFLCASCAGGPRREVTVSGKIEGYNAASGVDRLYVEELLLVPFPRNLATMSTYVPIGELEVSLDGAFEGTVYACGPLMISYGAFASTTERPSDGKARFSLSLADLMSEAADDGARDTRLRNFKLVAAEYPKPERVPCYPDLDRIFD